MHTEIWNKARSLKLGKEFLEGFESLLSCLESEKKQLIITDVICSSHGTKFKIGAKVCSYGDVTTFGYISHWDEQDGVWVLKTDKEGSFMWWSDDEPVLFENCK